MNTIGSHFLVLLLATALCLGVNCEEQKEKYVSAIVNAKWSETPFLLEASEFIYRHEPDTFWQFATSAQLNANIHLSHPQQTNNESYYNALLAESTKHLSSMQYDLLKLSLSLRTYSPAVEMQRRLASEVIASEKNKCLTFVDVHGQISCDPAQIESLIKTVTAKRSPFVYQFDKRWGGSISSTSTDEESQTQTTIILYAQIGTEAFRSFHEKILAISSANININKIAYFLRHNYEEIAACDGSSSNKVTISGYGVELDIKKTEYHNVNDQKVNEDDVKQQEGGNSNQNAEAKSVQGFMFGKLKQLHSGLSTQLDEYRKHLLMSELELAPLHAWQMQDLSFQAAQRVLDTATNTKVGGDPQEALAVLEDVAQNYPMRAQSLSKVTVKPEVRKALKAQRKLFESEQKLEIEAGQSAMFLNGLEVNIDTTDIFALATMFKKEARLIESLHSAMPTKEKREERIQELVYLDTKAKNDDYGVDIRDSSVQWLNNLEKDGKYASWGKRVQEMLRPMYPGMMRSIAKNFFHLVVMIDPSKRDARALLKTLESFYVNDVPVRIGFVFVTSGVRSDRADGYTDASIAMYRVYQFVKQNEMNSAPKALSFLTDLYARAPVDQDLTSAFIVREFKRKYPKQSASKDDLDEVFGVDSDYDEGRLLSWDYYEKVGLRRLPQVFLNGFPLTEAEIEADVFEESIITKVMTLTSDIQMAVYKSKIDDKTDLIDYSMNRDVIMPRLNPRVLSPTRNYIDIVDSRVSQFMSEEITYFPSSSAKSTFNPLTLWIVCDPDTEQGRQLLYDAVQFADSNNKVNVRLAVIYSSSSKENIGDESIIKRSISYALANPTSLGLKFIKKLLRERTFVDLKGKEKKSLGDLDLPFSSATEDAKRIADFDLTSVMAKHASFLTQSTPFKTLGDRGLIANGWVIGPLDQSESFTDTDFTLLESFILKTGLDQTRKIMARWNQESSLAQKIDDVAVKINCILGKFTSDEKRVKAVDTSRPTKASMHIKAAKSDEPFYDLVVILDPLTRAAQKVSTILRVLAKTTNINIHVYFNCKDKLSAPPLNSFYRYVLEPEASFSSGKKPLAYFRNMPQSPILTLNVQSPESWMVEVVDSPFDLDNIRLQEIADNNNKQGAEVGAYGHFELEHLIVEGHAYDVLSGQSPRGLQFNLGTTAKPNLYDTIVMANLGYFQLKASPGMWILKLRDGKSRDIYDVVSHENTDSVSKRAQLIRLVIDSFEAKVIKVKVSKKANKLNESLLDSDSKSGGQGGRGSQNSQSEDEDTAEEEPSIWSNLASKFTGGDESTTVKPEDINNSHVDGKGVLNIFSVASGHLYERLMRIMMYTVLKNTKASKVKFWFLKNYLSPQFTKFLPYYAKTYGFEFELVQYKWPRWLHHETEKQRIIWGYKILFLDVLFPLDVEKIIYVDADQIVRADLTELRDINLKGAPYGYTPFCDSRTDMDGYRFWKMGYWSSHLGHRKYHISALYVVDLKKFRKIAAGDRLRGQYQGLSQDPNSLSNLDQDLPNNMIHQVNIFSLPQEWLYCDAWCAPETLKKAKTIDLCNNPQTKEPKLEQAVRIVPEWKDYDQEISDVMKKWQAEEKSGASSSIPVSTASSDSTTTTTTTTPTTPTTTTTTSAKKEEL